MKDEETVDSADGVGGMFTGVPQHENFPLLKDIFPTVRMEAAATPFPFPDGSPCEPPETYVFGAWSRSSEAFHDETDTVALLVLQDGAVRHERYTLTGGRDVHWISWSVAKSFISALVGIAVAEGAIPSIEAPISDVVAGLGGSGYDGVRIEDILQMSSGASWNEDYSDPDSDVSRLGAVMSGELTLDELVTSISPDVPPGSLCRYNSADTQALGSLLVAATGTSIADYMQEKLYNPLGMESPGYWLTDSAGREMAFGGLLLTARDFAKLGELYRRGGEWDGAQVVPAQWVTASTRADAPHLAAGAPAGDTTDIGYGYQWWLPAGDRGDYTAIGVYNQFVYVDPASRSVIVKLSANRTYGTTASEESDRELETIAYLRAIADQLTRTS
ncbi:MAG: serine hydrolase [Acidimicrobiia bacterium]|nr:serine hydrolase [Acidimicrobiia bacterium]